MFDRELFFDKAPHQHPLATSPTTPLGPSPLHALIPQYSQYCTDVDGVCWQNAHELKGLLKYVTDYLERLGDPTEGVKAQQYGHSSMGTAV